MITYDSSTKQVQDKRQLLTALLYEARIKAKQKEDLEMHVCSTVAHKQGDFLRGKY